MQLNVAECSLYIIFHLLCILQEAYDRSKRIVIRTISSKLESLFQVQETKTEEMEDASRGYGLLLHAFSLRRKESQAQHAEAIKTEVRDTRVILMSTACVQKCMGELECQDKSGLAQIRSKGKMYQCVGFLSKTSIKSLFFHFFLISRLIANKLYN